QFQPVPLQTSIGNPWNGPPRTQNAEVPPPARCDWWMTSGMEGSDRLVHILGMKTTQLTVSFTNGWRVISRRKVDYTQIWISAWNGKGARMVVHLRENLGNEIPWHFRLMPGGDRISFIYKNSLWAAE